MKLSVSLIAKGKEELLRKCLESVKGVADEIIVADCGLDEAIKKDCSPLARIYPFTWADDFSKARNFSLSKSGGGIVFIIDADELLSPSDREALEGIKKDPPPGCWGITLKTRNYFADDVLDPGYTRNTGEYPEMEKGSSGFILSPKVRIFPNKKGIFFENRIHETVEKSILKQNGRIIIKEKPVIHHFGYLKSQKRSEEKQKIYEELLKKELDKNPSSFKALFDYAHQLFLQGSFKESYRHFQKAYALQKNEKAAFYLGMISLKLEKAEEALTFFDSIEEKDNPALFFHKGVAYKDSGRSEEAVKMLRQALRVLPGNPHVLQALGETYLQQGNENQAKFCFEKIKKVTQDTRLRTQDSKRKT